MRCTTWCKLLFAMMLAAATPLQAQEYPGRPIRIVVSNPPGGGTDTWARVIAEKLQGRWGQPVVVENRAGAAGNVGAEAVFKAEPDGYTLMFTAPPPLVVNKSLYAKLSYDPETFVPVSVVVTAPNVLLVRPKLAAETMPQLIALAKTHQGQLNYASGGSGSTLHLAAELFNSLAGVKIVHIPYKGSSPALADLMGGQVDMMFMEIGAALPHIRAGKVRALGVGSEKRSRMLPDIRSVAEVLPGFVSMVWHGVVAPPKTPSVIANRLSVAIAEALKSPDVAKRMQDQSVEPIGSTPEEMAQFMKQEGERWGGVIRATGTTAD